MHLAGASARLLSRDGRQPVQIAGASARLLSRDGRQPVQIGQIDGSLVQLVFVSWVSGHEIDQIEPQTSGLGSRSGRFKPRGKVRGSLVSLKEKARANGGPDRRSGRVLGVRRALAVQALLLRSQGRLDRSLCYTW